MLLTFWPAQCTSSSVTDTPLIAIFTLCSAQHIWGLQLSSKAPGRWVEPEGSGTLLQLRTSHRRLGPAVPLWGLDTHFIKRRFHQDCGWGGGVCEGYNARTQAWLLQSCQTLGDPTDCSLPGSSVHGILQARMLEWGAVPSSRGPARPRDRTQVSYISCMAGGFFTTSTTWEAQDAALDVGYLVLGSFYFLIIY